MPVEPGQTQSHWKWHLWIFSAVLVWVHSQLLPWGVWSQRDLQHDKREMWQTWSQIFFIGIDEYSDMLFWKGYGHHVRILFPSFILDAGTKIKLCSNSGSPAELGLAECPFTCRALDCDSPLSWRSGCFIKLPDLSLTRSFWTTWNQPCWAGGVSKSLLMCIISVLRASCIISPHIWVSGFFQKWFTIERTS